MKRPIESRKFTVRPVAAAVALATGAAWAAPTPNQMPGAGVVAASSLGSVNAVGTPYTNLPNGVTIPLDGKVVIRWGGPGAPAGEANNPHGFNLGANASLTFTGVAPGSSVLNIDASGNPSQIYGLLLADSKGGWTPSMFIANANGIVVGAGGRIVAPEGIGLVGANLDNATSRNEFVANNGWVVPAPQTLGTSYLSFGTIPASGNVAVGGQVNGDLVNNVPARYVLVAGNNVDVLNTGNLFGVRVDIRAGLVATATSAAVAGLSNQTVNRLWNVDAGGYEACCYVGPNPGNMAIVPGLSANVTNEGSISVAPPGGGGGMPPTRVQPANGVAPAEGLFIQAAGNVRSGVAGSTNDQVGLFSDFGILIDSYLSTSKVELYNVVSGYTTNKTLPFFQVNYYVGAATGFADVTLDALTPGVQPSSVATTAGVFIRGADVAIRSTINHKANSAGGTQGNAGLFIEGTKSVEIAASIGAGADVVVSSGGPLTISGNVLSDTNGSKGGGIYVFNYGTNAPTTISGTLTVPSSSSSGMRIETHGPTTVSGSLVSGNAVFVGNYGTAAGNHTTISGSIAAGGGVRVYNALSPAQKPLSVSGSITAYGDVDLDNFGAAAGNTTTIAGSVTSTGGDINVRHHGQATGKLVVSGALSAIYDVNLFSDGHAQLGGMGITAGDNINAEVLGTSLLIDGPWTAGDHIGVESLLAMAKLTPAGVLTAPDIDLMGLSFMGVNAAGNPYANTGEKPLAQIVTHDLEVVLTGSINAPVAGNTNWLLNSLDFLPMAAPTPAFVGAAAVPPVLVSVSAVGGGFQAVNLRVLGDAIVDSGATSTPFVNVPLTTGGLPAGGIQGNLGSQLILQADGYMQVQGSPTGSLFGPPVAFQWPGGAVFKAGTTLQTFAPVYNAYTTTSPPFGGVFFDAPYIALGGYLATSGTAWANFSSQPVSGDPAVFQIRQTSPTSFGFEATTAFVKNAYSSTVTGGAVCTTTGPTTWAACP